MTAMDLLQLSMAPQACMWWSRVLRAMLTCWLVETKMVVLSAHSVQDLVGQNTRTTGHLDAGATRFEWVGWWVDWESKEQRGAQTTLPNTPADVENKW